MTKRIRHGYIPDTGLSETRKADRAKMCARLAAICEEHGVPHEIIRSWCDNPNAIAFQIKAGNGLSMTLDFDPGSIQPNIFVMSWHFNRQDQDVNHHLSRVDWRDDAKVAEPEVEHYINPEVFLDHNDCHFRKATDVAHGWENLKSIITRRAKQIADGTATVTAKPKSPHTRE